MKLEFVKKFQLALHTYFFVWCVPSSFVPPRVMLNRTVVRRECVRKPELEKKISLLSLSSSASVYPSSSSSYQKTHTGHALSKSCNTHHIKIWLWAEMGTPTWTAKKKRRECNLHFCEEKEQEIKTRPSCLHEKRYRTHISLGHSCITLLLLVLVENILKCVMLQLNL